MKNDPSELIIFFFVLAFIAVYEALKTLLSILHKGVMKDRREILMKKTNSELRQMLNGMNKISRLNKKQLVEMVIACH